MYDSFVGLVGFVVGGVVCSVAVGVVAAPVFVAVACDVGGEGEGAAGEVGCAVIDGVSVFLVGGVGCVLGLLGVDMGWILRRRGLRWRMWWGNGK
jgi:hypothetical protein